MIPPDVANSLRSQLSDPRLPGPNAGPGQTQLPAAQRVGDALSNLIPGQRVLAEIQAQLPNGTYRAAVAQREITLALPFAAKSGDTLELEVVENEGNLVLAFVARRGEKGDPATGGARPAVETTLSRTASFIAGLLPRREHGEQAPPAVLNANRPIAAQPPTTAADLVPLLRQAIAQSGMFYEAHQSQWVNNRLPLEQLLAEPQGRLSTAQGPGQGTSTPASSAPPGQAAERMPQAADNEALRNEPAQIRQEAVQSRTATSPVPAELTPIVQQQLEALATQTYIWRGQAWPGQEMQWEIVEENSQRKSGGDEEPQTWQTALTLTMPQLGEVRAKMRLVAGEVAISLTTASGATALQLATNGEQLRGQLEAAGLRLNGFSVGSHEPEPE